MSSRIVSLLDRAPFNKQGPSADFEKVKGGRLPKRDTNLELIPFKDKEPIFTRLKSVLAIRLLSKGQFYIRAMPYMKKPLTYFFLSAMMMELMRL